MNFPGWFNVLIDLAKKSPLHACAAGLALLSAAHITRLIIAIATFFVELIAEDLTDCWELLKRFGGAVTPWRRHSLSSSAVAREQKGTIPSDAINLVLSPLKAHRRHAKTSTLRELRERFSLFSRQLHIRRPERNLPSEMTE